MLGAMKPTLPTLMSLNGGYVDTAGFLALNGLFTAHVTGNFVTFGAAMVNGTAGGLTKLLALPVFCAMVLGTRLLAYRLPPRGLPVLKTMLVLQVLLLAAGAALAIGLGPFPKGDSWAGFTTGMVLVAAMAIQNAAHRIHLGSAPPTTLMTGTTTQVMIDLADMLHGSIPPGSPARARLGRMVTSVAAFAVGCGAAALCYSLNAGWCFVVPVLVALPGLWSAEVAAAGDGTPERPA